MGLIFIIGAVFGVLVTVAGIKTVVAAGRIMWKYAIGLLILFVIGVVLVVMEWENQQRYTAYQITALERQLND